MPTLSRMFAAVLLFASAASAEAPKPAFSPAEKSISERLKLRSLPDAERARATRDLAMEIRALPASPNKLELALNLANLATEGDYDPEVLQQVTTTLAIATGEHPATKPTPAHRRLAELVRYEGMKAELSDSPFVPVLRELNQIDRERASAQFRLRDLDGKEWTLSGLRGKTVLINFWATWCPPCRAEMPDLQKIWDRFRDHDLVVVAITDDTPEKVRAFLAEFKYNMPVLFDKNHRTWKAFWIGGIPESFVFDAQGRLVAQALDARTERQFLKMLEKAGLSDRR